MQIGNLGVIERKVLGALIMLADNNNVVTASMNKLAEVMGYNASGGALTFAVKILERDNFIVKTDRGKYKILI